MINKYHVLSLAFATAIVLTITGLLEGSESATPMEQTLQAVHEYMIDHPVPWPETWQNEYIDTIRRATVLPEEPSDYTMRLSILKNGFPPYWENLPKSRDRSLFEVHCAQIRWYTEHLMCSPLPSKIDKQILSNQWKDICDHATDSLLTQFPFLDPNEVQSSKMDYLSRCNNHIRAPLVPGFTRPLSEVEMNLIENFWHKLRYDRINLCRQIVGDEVINNKYRDLQKFKIQNHGLFTQKCLNQLLAQTLSIVTHTPDYYRTALANQIEARKQWDQMMSGTRRLERGLQQKYSGQLPQTEYLGFLLVALLETPQCLEESQLGRTKKNLVQNPDATTNRR